MQREAGFSLLELIAVMAVMAILAGTMAPNIAASVDRAYRDSERQTLSVLAQDLRQAIVNDKRIPSPSANTWGQAIARVSEYPLQRIIANDKGYRRRLLVDPQFFAGPARHFKGYVQKKGLQQPPQSPRMMLVSDLRRHVPALKNDAAVFDAIWHQRSDAMIKESKDLLIERINLADQFHRLVVGNQNKQRTFFRLENGPAVAVPKAIAGRDGSLTRYVIHGSRLLLHHAPYPSGTVQQVTVVQADTAWHYQSQDPFGNGTGSAGPGNSGQSQWRWVQP